MYMAARALRENEYQPEARNETGLEWDGEKQAAAPV
jgi:hypothetical protein